MPQHDPSSHVQFAILGPLEVLVGGEPVQLPPKHRALIAMLLLRANEPVSIDALADGLWSGRPPATAANSLQVSVSQLRGRLEPNRSKGAAATVLVTRRPGYMLCLEPAQLDVTAHEQLAADAAACLANDPARAAELLGAALALWRGQPLAGFEYEEWALAECARLGELRLATVEARVEADLACGRHHGLVSELEALIGAHPYRERLRAQLMLALYRSGRQAEALETYQAARRTLLDELGIEPGPQLQELERQILQQDPSLMLEPAAGGSAAPGAPPASATRRHTQLPAPVSTFVGRGAEVGTIAELLAEPATRLVTLSGPGGIGKSRLAAEAGRAASDAFADGVAYVDLAPVTSPDLVPLAIAAALGAPEAGDDADAELLVRLVGERSLLLVVDNFEHVMPAAELLGQLLGQTGSLTALVTSRERLHLYGEHEFPVPPLVPDDAASAAAEVDPGHDPAVRLFVDRAGAVAPGFAPEPQELRDIAAICQRLDRLPLAIELAAARVRLLSTGEILERLEDRLGDITSGRRDAPARQRSLRATIDWSFSLLGTDEQRLFARLSTFVGGFTVDAADVLCGHEQAELSGIELVESLLDKSLVQRAPGHGGPLRCTMLESVSQYAGELLAGRDDAADAHDAHLDWCVAVARRTAALLFGPQQQQALQRLRAELGNVRAAAGWAIAEGRWTQLAALVEALAPFWVITGTYRDASAWTTAALAAESELQPDARARLALAAAMVAQGEGNWDAADSLFQRAREELLALGDEAGAAAAASGLGEIAAWRGSYEQAEGHLQHALAGAESVDDRWRAAWSRSKLGWVMSDKGEHEAASALMDQSLTAFRELGDDRCVAGLLNNLGLVESDLRNYTRAADLLEESLLAFRRMGDQAGLAMALGNRADVMTAVGDYDGAERTASEALAISRTLDDPAQLSHALEVLGLALAMRGDAGRARELLAESLSVAVELDDARIAAQGLEGLARLAAGAGDHAAAASLYGAADSLWAGGKWVLGQAAHAAFEQDISHAREALGAEAFDEAWASLRGLPLADAVERALATASRA